jgi:hypothetical protein
LRHVASLEDLETLYLTGTQVTDVGLGMLARLSKLTLLDLGGTSTTDGARKRLRQALPELEE